MQTRSLKAKFLFAILLTTIIALIVASSSRVMFNLHNYRDNVVEDLNAQAALLGRAVTPALQFNDPESAKAYLNLLGDQPHILQVVIFNERGKLFASYERDGNTPKLIMSPDIQGIKRVDDSLVLHQRVIFDNQIVGAVFVKIHYDLKGKLLGNLAIAIGSIFLAVIVAFVLSLRLQKTVIGQIHSLIQLAEKLTASKDYTLRANKISDNEIGGLVDAFNQMLDEVARGRHDLELSNQELKAEVEERRLTESALKESEEKVSNLNSELEQRVLNRTAQLEMANKELESFSYSVSHDLRSPLRAIDGFSQALIEDYADKLDGDGKDYLQRVRSAAQKMGSLIDDMLKLSNVSRAEMNLRSVDLSDLAKSVIEELHAAEPNRKVAIKVTSGLSAYCDSHLVKIALVNLLSNAWKYTSKVQNAEIEFGMRLVDSEAAFFVEDNGAGFDMAYAGKLFGAFQRLHTASEFPGTGIGLATVKRVISRHGGRIWAESSLNEGATFYFTIPPKERSMYEDMGVDNDER